MSKKKECTICKHLGHKTDASEDLERTSLFNDDGDSIHIYLCRSHSVSLFQKGQTKFLLGFYSILVNLIDSDEPKFIELLHTTCKNNPDQIY